MVCELGSFSVNFPSSFGRQHQCHIRAADFLLDFPLHEYVLKLFFTACTVSGCTSLTRLCMS